MICSFNQRLILCLILYLTAPSIIYGNILNIAPVYYHLSDDKGLIVDVIGEFIESAPNHTALRPVFFHHREFLDILYPLGHFTKEKSRFTPIYSRLNQDNHTHTDLFPVFYGKHDGTSYGGLFPVYGTMHHRYGYDRASFFLWPLYAQHINNDDTTHDILWPIFTYCPDKSFKVFPIYGHESSGTSTKEYLLWPIAHRKRGKDKMDAFLPLFMSSRGDTFRSTSILWPFFTYNRDFGSDHTSLDCPWPIIRFARGAYEENRFFPFYWETIKGTYNMKTILWPLYTRKVTHDKGTGIKQKKISILILSSISHIEQRGKNATDSLTIWPLLNREKRDGASSWRFPYIIPFHDDGIERNLSPILTLAKKSSTRYSSDINILWHTLTYHRTHDKKRFFLSFLYSYKEDPTGSQNGFFFDLIHFQTEQSFPAEKK